MVQGVGMLKVHWRRGRGKEVISTRTILYKEN
jgi:hypothetical protein